MDAAAPTTASTAAGLLHCETRRAPCSQLKTTWAELDSEALSLHRLVQTLAERVGRVSTSVLQLKEASDSLPTVSSDLKRATEVVKDMAGHVVGTEAAVVQLEVERARAEHLQQSREHHRQVEQALLRNEESVQTAEADYKDRVSREHNLVAREEAAAVAALHREATELAVMCAAGVIVSDATLYALDRPQCKCSFCTTVYSAHLAHCPMCGEKSQAPAATEPVPEAQADEADQPEAAPEGDA
eukprot:TRINITY_DN37595_c0_g1_i1.p1 TRINITY_DN37595_c0_g1~~TRINITY_DN37595_c0_g1_i1.p1  ORF type:complete len:243 (+),score=68.88 TRINITY_DN37595_c0_g1_i1:323-1051(+)